MSCARAHDISIVVTLLAHRDFRRDRELCRRRERLWHPRVVMRDIEAYGTGNQGDPLRNGRVQ